MVGHAAVEVSEVPVFHPYLIYSHFQVATVVAATPIGEILI